MKLFWPLPTFIFCPVSWCPLESFFHHVIFFYQLPRCSSSKQLFSGQYFSHILHRISMLPFSFHRLYRLSSMRDFNLWSSFCGDVIYIDKVEGRPATNICNEIDEESQRFRGCFANTIPVIRKVKECMCINGYLRARYAVKPAEPRFGNAGALVAICHGYEE